jgi:hypothetical protein
MSSDLGLVESSAPKPTRKEMAIESAYMARATQLYAKPSDCDIEIDDEPKVSIGEGGAWVAAWVWVSQEEAGLPKKGRTRAANI